MRCYDDLGLIHDKPVETRIDESGHVRYLPSSNNGWIYTAFLSKFFTFSPERWEKLQSTFMLCHGVGANRELSLIRLPKKHEPPMSRDEVIGMFALGFLSWKDLRLNNWYFHGVEPTHYSWPRVIWEMFKIRKEHRNHFWQNDIVPVYRAAFKLWHHDRCFVKISSGIKPTMFETFCFLFYAFVINMKGTHGEKNILWLQYKQMGFEKAASRMNYKETFSEYFGKDHPIARGANGVF